MKLLVYNWNSFTGNDVNNTFKRMNISFDTFTYNFNASGHSKLHDEEFNQYFKDHFNTSLYDAVFSINYWPAIAEACYLTNIKYISWSYDCPFDIPSPEDTLKFPNVYCFVFDKIQHMKFAEKGLSNVFYLPLGVDEEKYRKINSHKSQCDKFRTEVSFIGGLYYKVKKNSCPLISALVNESTRSVLKQIVEVQRNNPSVYILDDVVTDNFANLVNLEMHANDHSFKDIATKNKIIFAIQVEIARLDRITMLNLSGKRYKTDFYSGDSFEILGGVTPHGYVDYNTEMPWIFAASKINLNPTLPAIQSGVNQRAFDITACGGFLLMNEQPELSLFFEPQKEIGVYNSMVDYVDKLNYYMSHDTERQKIADAGRERCLTEHTIKNRLEVLFSTSNLF